GLRPRRLPQRAGVVRRPRYQRLRRQPDYPALAQPRVAFRRRVRPGPARRVRPVRPTRRRRPAGRRWLTVGANLAPLGAAAVFLALSLATFWWGTQAAAIGHRHTVLVFTWLSAAISTTLIVFSMFPSSTADGQVLGVTLGGAGAFVLP